MTRTRRKTTASHASASRTPPFKTQTLQSRTILIREPVNPEKDNAIRDAATAATDTTILPPSPQREEDAPAQSFPQVSPSFETKELLANLMNLL